MKKRSKAKTSETCCPLTSSPRKRLASDAQTAAIKNNFPPGIAKPALRALFAAGFTTLDQLAQTAEEQIAQLHGMGPKAINTLRAALNQRGLEFQGAQPQRRAQPQRKVHSKPRGTSSIGEYISQFPADVRAILEKVRATIRKAAPDAKEVISYQMPAFKQHGILVYFAAWKEHIGLYPPISGDESLQKEVAPYAGPKGNLQFPLNERIPYKLIERIVKLRVVQDNEKLAKKKSKTTALRKPRVSK
ncbi:MAG: DUF1801 domain-containing protein [Pirellulales bacterium]